MNNNHPERIMSPGTGMFDRILKKSLKRDNRIKLLLYLGALLFGLTLNTSSARAAEYIIAPESGTYEVGSTFDVSIYLDTQNESVNAVEVALKFPTEKLQVVTPSSLGKSVVGLWVTQPTFDNQNGLIRLQGGIPGGIKASRSLISTVTFRVRSVGNGSIRFLDESKILLNDGKGTNVYKGSRGGIYTFVLPPPMGPRVTSPTHAEATGWQKNNSPVFIWQSDEDVDGYSYALSEAPVDIPDNIVDSKEESVSYKDVPDGTRYFHVKALKNGRWGGVTHFSVNIDTLPPAAFEVVVSPSAKTEETEPMLRFTTSDKNAGIDYYEMKVVPLTLQKDGEELKQLFFEVQSPHVLKLEKGRYDVIVRAYDKAGNHRDVVKHVEITTPLLKWVGGEGLMLGESTVLSWSLVFALLISILCGVIFGGMRVRKIYLQHLQSPKDRVMPKEISKQLDELKRYKKKYGSLVVMLLIAFGLVGGRVSAATPNNTLNTPYISVVAEHISNEDIFYVGGKSNEEGSFVVLHIQNLDSGSVITQKTNVDKDGNWFYEHNSFLVPGKYIVWVQGEKGQEVSAPSPQVSIEVERTALQFGASRISFETLYLLIALILLMFIIIGSSFIVIKLREIRKKRQLFAKEMLEVEEAIRRGFVILKRDIQSEIAAVRKANLDNKSNNALINKEEQLMKDLELIEARIGKEILDVEHLGL